MIRHWHGPIKAYDEEMDRQLSIQPLLHSAHFLIVNKPFDINIDNGKCDTPDSQVSRSGRPSVESVLQKRYPSYYLRNCHQLDYGTSGCYVIALTKEAASQTGKMFAARQVKKMYLALVWGHCTFETQQVTKPIGSHPTQFTKMTIDSDGINGKHAKTDMTVLRRGYFNSVPCTLLKLQPESGRRHQLRLHCAFIGHPIIGDLQYEDSLTPSFRMFLHAQAIELEFPACWSFSLIHVLKRMLTDDRKHWKHRIICALKSCLDYEQKYPVSEPIKIHTQDPFSQYITDEPSDTVHEKYGMSIRMSRHEWVNQNILKK